MVINFEPIKRMQNRRRLLQLAAASAATLWLSSCARSQPRLTSDPFELGVASDSLVLWTSLVPPGFSGSSVGLSLPA